MHEFTEEQLNTKSLGVPGTLEALDKAISEHEELLDSLRAKLGGVLRPEIPLAEVGAVRPDGSVSALRERVSRLGELNTHLREIIQRIDL